MSIDFKGLLGQGATTAGQYAIMEKAKDRIKEIPEQIRTGMTTVSDMASPYTQFKPFTVTTGTGASTTLGPEGMTMQLSPEQQQLSNMLQQQAMQQAQQMGSVTPESLMSQMQALRQPEQERAQLGLENRLAAQGRLGVQTNAYGGTPEQLAMQKAIQEQQSADALASIQGARQLQQQDLGLAQGMLGLSYLPQQQALSALSPAIQTQQIGAGLGQTQANLIGQLGQQYLGEVGSAGRTSANLSTQQANMLLRNLLGSAAPAGSTGGASSSGALGGLIGSIVNQFTGGGSSGGSTGTLGGTTGQGSTTPLTVSSFLNNLGVYDPYNGAGAFQDTGAFDWLSGAASGGFGSGGGSGVSSPDVGAFTIDSFLGNAGVYDPDKDNTINIFGTGGGGI